MKAAVYFLFALSVLFAGCSNSRQPDLSDEAQEIVDEKDAQIEELQSEVLNYEDKNAELQNKLENISELASEGQLHLDDRDYDAVENILDEIETEATY